MSIVTIPYRFGLRGGLAADLAAVNEVPLIQELVFETDTLRFKFGDGVTNYNDLEYASYGNQIGNLGDITITLDSNGDPVWTINDNAVTYAKMQNVSATSRVIGRRTAGAGDPEECTLSEVLDFLGSAARGDILYRGASAWFYLPPGNSGEVLQTQGVGADPQWATVQSSQLGFSDLPFYFEPLTTRGSWSKQNVRNGSTTTDSFGGLFASSVQGTATGVSVTATSAYTRQLRTAIVSAAGAGSAASSYNTTAVVYFDDGFFFSYRFGVADAAAVANAREFVGLRASTSAPANADPSTFVDCIGIGNDTGDANLSMIHNDGSGTATKVDLGAFFPANTQSTDFYELQMLSLPGTLEVKYHVRNCTTGATTQGIITTDLPASGTSLARTFWRNNGTTALAVRFEYGANMFAPSLLGM